MTAGASGQTMPERKPRLLVVSWAYYPRSSPGAHRAAKLAKYLPSLGWEPVILTVREACYRPLVDRALKQEIPIGQRIIRTHDASVRTLARVAAGRKLRSVTTGNSLQDRSLLGRRLRERLTAWFDTPGSAGWLPFGLLGGHKAASGCRAIWATSPPSGALCLALLLAGATRLPLVVDLRDPWHIDTPGFYPTAAHRAVDVALERAVLTRAARVVVVTDAMRREYARRYPELDSRLSVIHNGYDPDDFGPAPARPAPASEGICRIGYFGSLYQGREEGMRAVLRAAARLDRLEAARRNRIRVTLRGPDPQVFRSMPEECGAAHFVDAARAVPRSESLFMMGAMDILLVIGSRLHPSAISGKIFDYLGAGRPILAVTPEGELSRFVTRLGIGLSVEPDCTDGIAVAIRQLLERKDAFLRNIEQIRPKFTREAAARQLAQVLTAVVGTAAAESQPCPRRAGC